MKRKGWEVKIYKNFEEAEAAEREYWQNASYEKRIETMLYLQQLMLELFYPEVKRMEKVVSFRKYGPACLPAGKNNI